LEIWKGFSTKLFWPPRRKSISEKKLETMIVASTTFSNRAVRCDQFLLGAGASSASMFGDLLDLCFHTVSLIVILLFSWIINQAVGGDQAAQSTIE
jgi:hypothetical protein